MPVRNQNEGLIYIRRSSNRQEASMETQLNWALQQAAELKVYVDASIKDLNHMLASSMNSYKSLRIDDAVTGSDLNRTGFCALFDDATKNKSISHIFAYRRDRLARPEDASDMMGLERRVREAGVTLVLKQAYPAREVWFFWAQGRAVPAMRFFASGGLVWAIGERLSGLVVDGESGAFRTPVSLGGAGRRPYDAAAPKSQARSGRERAAGTN